MLSKGFRLPEIDILFKLRFFIQNLHTIIASTSNETSLTSIYRAHRVTSDELDTLKKCANGGLLAFSSFFTASTEQPKDEETPSDDDEQEQQQLERVLFKIDVSNSNNYMLIDDQVLVTHEMLYVAPHTAKRLQFDNTAHFVILGGEPFATPRFVWWNLVSSSREKIEHAKQSWKDGTFPMVPGETEFIPAPD